MTEMLLAFLRGLMQREVWEANRAALGSKDVLTNRDVQALVGYISELHGVYDRDLRLSDLRRTIEAKHSSSPDRMEELLELVSLVGQSDDLPFEEVQPLISDFLCRELSSRAMMYIGNRSDSDSYDVNVPLELLTLASELSTGVDLDVEDMCEAPPPAEDAEREGLCTIGLGKEMDAELCGGMANGEMLIWLAGPGVGKTSFMINQGVEMALAGEHVLHVSLEINKAKCRQRVDQKLTGMSRSERLRNPALVMSARERISKAGGKFLIKDWSARDITVGDIRTLVRNLRSQGQKVTTICVDYLELMAPTTYNRHGERFNHSTTARDLRRLGNELGVKIVTAWQVNRAGFDKHVIGKTDVSECWDIVKHADIIMGLNQNEEELREKNLRINIIKQRESTSRPLLDYYADLDRMVVKYKDTDHDDVVCETGVKVRDVLEAPT